MSANIPSTAHRFYREYADWWPLISPVEDYADEAAFAATILRSGAREVRTVLELGSGGGHNATFLAEHFAMTLVDLSEDMLEVSRRLNPGCEHICGDMRHVRLGADFDAVFVHDAVDYMTTEADLDALMQTAFVHCRPGGLVVFLPDDTLETFAPSTEHGGVDGPDGRGVRILEWSWDPDPTDTWVVTEFAFLFRHADGRVTSAHETHHFGIFSEATWMELLARQGFRPEMRAWMLDGVGPLRRIFVGHVE